MQTDSPVTVEVSILRTPRELDARSEATLMASLTLNERDRFARIPSRRRALEFLYGRAMLRLSRNVYTSVSHSRGCVTTASARCPVGIDVAAWSPSIDRIVQRFFTASEKQWLDEMSLEDRRNASVRLWAIKEACCKVWKKGLRFPLTPVHVPLAETGYTDELAWRLIDLKGTHALCVAVARSN